MTNKDLHTIRNHIEVLINEQLINSNPDDESYETAYTQGYVDSCLTIQSFIDSYNVPNVEC